MESSISFVLGILMFQSFRVISSDYAVESFNCYEKNNLIDIKCKAYTSFALKEVNYGFPVNNISESNIHVECLRNETDCWNSNQFWSFMKNGAIQKCSGTSNCRFQTTHDQRVQLISNSTSECQNASLYSRFLILEGQCLYEEKKINFCEERKISGSKIYIHNPNDIDVDYACDCTVESAENLNLDVIMFALNFSETKNCSSSLRIDSGKDNLTLTCSDFKKFENITISNSNKINLKLTKNQPQKAYQIWLKVHSHNYDKVTVHCRKMPTVTPSSTLSPAIIEARQMSDFMTGVEIACGVVVGVILITLIIVTVITYRRYARIIGGIKKPPKTSNNDQEPRRVSIV